MAKKRFFQVAFSSAFISATLRAESRMRMIAGASAAKSSFHLEIEEAARVRSAPEKISQGSVCARQLGARKNWVDARKMAAAA